jgi:hypothetical protein
MRPLPAPAVARAGDAMADNHNGHEPPNEPVTDVDNEPYRVGYGRPPKATQFKPGVSGFPSGRPKRKPSFSEVTEQVLNKKIEMRAGDRVLRMSNKEALVQSAIRQALAGKPRLLAVLPAIMRHESESHQGRGEVTLDLAADDEAILADFLARHSDPADPTERK